MPTPVDQPSNVVPLHSAEQTVDRSRFIGSLMSSS
jgi:hypothetical protein